MPPAQDPHHTQLRLALGATRLSWLEVSALGSCPASSTPDIACAAHAAQDGVMGGLSPPRELTDTRMASPEKQRRHDDTGWPMGLASDCLRDQWESGQVWVSIPLSHEPTHV